MRGTRWLALLAVLATTACSTVASFWSGGPKELSRVREDAVTLQCDAGKSLVYRLEPGGKSAWIILPEREFRLDRLESAGGTQYSNGRTTLVVKGSELSLEEAGATSFANCRKPQT